MTTFSDRPGYQRVSSTLWKQREDYCAGLIQKAWKFHKLRNTESHTEEPHTDEESSLAAAASSSQQQQQFPKAESKHLIDVKSAEEEEEK